MRQRLIPRRQLPPRHKDPAALMTGSMTPTGSALTALVTRPTAAVLMSTVLPAHAIPIRSGPVLTTEDIGTTIPAPVITVVIQMDLAKPIAGTSAAPGILTVVPAIRLNAIPAREK